MPKPPPDTDTPLLGESERHALLLLARDSIRHGLDNGKALSVDLDAQPKPLRARHACFVTLHLNDRLRGCIGHLEAVQPLALDVAENAFAAAFRDPRFSPATITEFEALHIEISVLTPSEPLVFGSEEELLALLRPGIDGIILAEGQTHNGIQNGTEYGAEHGTGAGHRGTFLPSVWEQLPQPRDFLHHLKLKAGMSPDYWSDHLRAWRYRTESFGE